MGQIQYGLGESEAQSLAHRRPLYVVQDQAKGDVLSKENFRSIRPGHGLAPRYLDVILGKRVNKTVLKGAPMSWDLLG